MLSVTKLAAKLAIVGSAVYVTVDNSIWDKSEYAKEAIGKVKHALPETAELIKDLPSTNVLANTWNSGVEKVFNSVANVSVTESTSKLIKSLTSESDNNGKKPA